jgi:DNA-binding transcriptional LysR family regulator
MMDWDDLRFVLAVQRGGGVSGAARALNVNHSTVSRRISALEKRIGVRLFDRLPSGYAPTEAGQEAVAAAQDMELTVLALDRTVAARDNRPSGTVTVTAPLMIIMGPFMDALVGFRQRHPQIDVQIRATNDLLSLERRESDVAIRASDAPDESLFGLRVTEQRAAAYASPDYLARHREALAERPAEAELEWLGHLDQTAPPTQVTAVYPRTRLALPTNDKLAALAAAKAGLGICRLPCFWGDRDPGLRRVPGLPLARYPDKWLLTHPDLASVERIRLFMRFATEAIRPLRPLFMGECPLGAERPQGTKGPMPT